MRINDYIKKRAAGSQPAPENGQNTREMLDKYGKMNEEQLMQEMFKNAAISRANGTLNDEMLDNFYSNAKAFLTPEQAERMRELIRELKK